jgi:hypothetical protein
MYVSRSEASFFVVCYARSPFSSNYRLRSRREIADASARSPQISAH